MRRRSLLPLVLLMLTIAPSLATADLVEGPWESSSGGLMEIVPSAPGSFVATMVRSGSSRCAAPPGAQPMTLNGSFPDYHGSRSYSFASTCAPSGSGKAVYAVTRTGLTICSKAPGRGEPRLDDPGSDCVEMRRPGADTTRRCGAVRLRGRRVVAVDRRKVLGDADHLGPAAYDIATKGASCGWARRLLRRVLIERDERLTLQSAGLPFVRTAPARGDGRRAYVVDAAFGGMTLQYRRLGGEPTPDHRIYRAGQQLVLSKSAGRSGDRCTGGFPVSIPGRGAGAVTAGHCGKDNAGADQPTVYWEPGGRTRLLGRVSRNALPAGADALLFEISQRWDVAAQIERGDLPPLTVVGMFPRSAQFFGMPACLAGRVSGADRCGVITGAEKGHICTTIVARRGDSGGPVYSKPIDRLTRALGLTTYVKGGGTGVGPMCYTPIDEVLQQLGGAQLSTYR